MTGWLILIGYVTGFLVVWRRWFCWFIDSDTEDDRLMAGVLSWALATFWPLSVPTALVARLITQSPTPGERKKAREEELAEELAKVRRMAREHGLPL